MPKQPQAGKASAKPQDDAVGDVSRGVVVPPSAAILTEDQKRAMGIDASQAEGAGEHDDSPEANMGVAPGGSVLDTYAGVPAAEHGNYAGPGIPVALGQAPQTPSRPMRGSPNEGEVFDPDIPNAINRSPIIRGREFDPRNDPSHPDFASADRAHPDYGRPLARHKGVAPDVPTYNDLKVAKAVAETRAAADDEKEQAAA